MLRWKSLERIFNDRDLITGLGPAPSREASESFPAPPGVPDERGAGAPSVCFRLRRDARSENAPLFSPQEAVLRVSLSSTPGTRPWWRHTAPTSENRHVGAGDPPRPAPAGGSCHPSPGGLPHIFPTSGPASRRPKGGVSPPLTDGGKIQDSYPLSPSPPTL